MGEGKETVSTSRLRHHFEDREMEDALKTLNSCIYLKGIPINGLLLTKTSVSCSVLTRHVALRTHQYPFCLYQNRGLQEAEPHPPAVTVAWTRRTAEMWGHIA